MRNQPGRNFVKTKRGFVIHSTSSKEVKVPTNQNKQSENHRKSFIKKTRTEEDEDVEYFRGPESSAKPADFTKDTDDKILMTCVLPWWL